MLSACLAPLQHAEVYHLFVVSLVVIAKRGITALHLVHSFDFG